MIPSALHAKPIKAAPAAPDAAGAEKRLNSDSPSGSSGSPKKMKLDKIKPHPMEVEKKATAESKSDDVTSVGVVLFTLIAHALYLWVTQGDRTKKKGKSSKFWAAWEEEWWKVPHNTFPIQVREGKHIPLHVPASAHASGQPHQYSREECLRAMLTHAVTKKWFPKRCFTEAEWKEAQDKPPVEVVKGLSKEKITEFESMLIRFSDWQEKERHFLQELGMETCKKGESAAKAAKRCASEELCQNNLTLKEVGTYTFSTERKGVTKTRISAAFAAWRPADDANYGNTMKERQNTCNWFGPHSWFKYLPGIVVPQMEKIKDHRETRHGRWLHVNDARLMLDPKNLQLLNFVMKELFMTTEGPRKDHGMTTA